MLETSVRLASADEYPTLTALYEAWGYQAGIAAADVVYVAERSGVIVGIVRRAREEGLTLLRGMFVRPAEQGTGVGTLLLTKFASELGEDVCYCLPFAHLTTFYGRVGFMTVSEAEIPTPLASRLIGFRREGHDVLVMRRRPSSRTPQ